MKVHGVFNTNTGICHSIWDSNEKAYEVVDYLKLISDVNQAHTDYFVRSFEINSVL